MTDLLVIRPQPGATATATAAARIGLSSTIAPLFTVEPVEWTPPAGGHHDALLLTSANAVRHAGVGLAGLAGLPAYVVGGATAEAARAAGLSVVHAGTGDVAHVLEAMAAAGVRAPLHLVGEDHVPARHAMLPVTRITVYRARAGQALSDEALAVIATGTIALIHSPRAGRVFADCVASAGLRRDRIGACAISAAASSALGPGWGRSTIADAPNDAALLAAAARLCEERRDRDGAQG